MRIARAGVLLAALMSMIGVAHAAENSVTRSDAHRLVSGDGRVTTSGPQPGYIYVCTTAPFARAPRGGGHAPWLRADGTFDPAEKPTVAGSVRWPSQLAIAVEGDRRVIASNALPSSPTGTFPIAPESEAYRYDRNPNAIQPQSVRWSLPRVPAVAAAPTCLGPGGPIGLLVDGSYLFNALDAAGRDGVAHEVQDACGGHPARRGDYHHHMAALCIDLGDPHGTSPIVGYALDGFAIAGPYRDGRLLTNADLDACHGRVDEIEWDGERRRMYHYVANYEYPYTLGCYAGTPIPQPPPQGRGDRPRPPSGGRAP